MSLAQTPPGLPLTRRSPRRGSLVGGSRRGSTLPAKVRQAERRCPRERVCLVHAGAGAILPMFCPTDLHRAARACTTPNDQSSCAPADQSECDSGEPRRTDPHVPHSAENRKVGGSIPSLPTTSARSGHPWLQQPQGTDLGFWSAAVGRRPGQRRCGPIAAGPGTSLPALLRQRFEDVTVA
jgi:hypothetical protein